MAIKSIIELDVQDDKYKAFLASFTKYQEALKEMPASWAEMGENASELTKSIGEATAALLAQREVHRQEDQAEKKREALRKEVLRQTNEADKRQKKVDDDRKKADEAAEKKRRKAIEDTKKIASNVADATRAAVKWAALDVGAGLIGGAATLWGLDRLFNSVGNERRTAQGLGVTTAQRQALSVNLSRYVDVNGALEGVANAQNDPSKQWIWAGLGIQNAAALDNATLLERAMRQVSAQSKQVSASQLAPWAEAHGWTQLFSMDEIRRLKAISSGELNAALRDTNRDIGKFGLSDENSRKWQQFMIRIDEAGWALKNRLVDKLTALNDHGQLDRIITGFGDLAVGVLDRVDFKAVGDKLSQFADYVESARFQTAVRNFVDDFVEVARKIHDALVFLHIIPDRNNTPGKDPALNPYLAGGPVTAPTLAGGLGAIGKDIFGDKRENAVDAVAMKQLTGMGVSPSVAAAIVAQFDAESGNTNHKPYIDTDGKVHMGGMGFGPAWQTRFAAMFGHDMQHSSFSEQWKFVADDLRMNHKALWAKLQTESAAQAAADLTSQYVRPKDMAGESVRRGARAEVILHIDNKTGHDVATSANQVAQ